MNMLIEELQGLAADPRSWSVAVLMAILAGVSVFKFFRCPHAAGTYAPTDEEVETARRAGSAIGPRFGLMMLAGVALTLAGLFMIAGGVRPTLALAMMVVGIVIIQTEPYRLQISEQIRAVIAARDAPAATIEGARDRLRSNQFALALTNVVLLAGLIVGLMVF